MKTLLIGKSSNNAQHPSDQTTLFHSSFVQLSLSLTQTKRDSLCLRFRAGFFVVTRDLKFIQLKASRKVDKETFLPEPKK